MPTRTKKEQKNEKKRKTSAQVPSRPVAAEFPIVGVGASAGGLEAFKQLLEPLPAKPGMAFVLIQHLDPTHTSLLGPALAQSSKMPVREVEDGERVEANHVYVMPSNTTLTIRRGVLKLLPRGPSTQPNMPVDLFLRALAEDVRSRAIGVVLSGTAHDGTLGLAAIKAEGGTTIVQLPETAKFDGMPRSAINARVADLVLAPEQIAAELMSPRPHAPETVRGLSRARTESSLSTLFERLRNATDVDFSAYKRSTILRRLARRLAIHKLARIDEYLAYVDGHPEELRSLHDDLLIHVTEFFRDPEAFEVLRTRILPTILDQKPEGAPIRIWVPGCSTGEEVYSIAILLCELASKKNVQHPIQIFGSDISESAITRARAGLYSENVLRELGEERLRRFFKKQDGNYRVQQVLREKCVFVRHDVTNDPPFSKLDLISCRNVLIYFDAALQKRTLPLLHYALNDSGFLLLGRSEAITAASSLFSLVDKTNKIFVRKPGQPRTGPSFAVGASREVGLEVESRSSEHRVAVPEFQREMEQALLARYAPAAVVVNEDLEILHFRGRTGRYLEPPPGHAKLDLLRMAREGLAPALHDILAEAKRTGLVVRRERVVSRQDGHIHKVNLEALPMRSGSPEQRSYLVSFEDAHEAPAGAAKRGKKKARETRAASSSEQQLRRELAETKAFLQSLLEQQEATNDELVSTNEELLSGNEELQSTNEEMNTAKEELQSANEELVTVNDELEDRNHELSRLNDDLVNLLASVDIAIVILDRHRNIRRFTPKSRALMNLIPSDIGRPIADINPTVEVPLLDAWITESLETLGVKEAEVQDREGRWYRLQIRPYRTSGDLIDGVVVSFVDIDALKRTAADAIAARDLATRIVETVPIPMLLLDSALDVKSANAAFYATFHLTPEMTIARPIQELTRGGWLPALMKEPLDRALETRSSFELVEVDHEVPGGGRRTMMLTGRMIDGGTPLVLIAIQDVTDMRRAQENRLRVATLEEANREKDLFLAMLSHELRTPLNSILLWSQVLRHEALPEAIQRAVRGIEQSANAQSQIVDDLLDVSRLVSGKLQIAHTEVDLVALVRRTVDVFHADAVAKHITLEAKCDPALPHVIGDAKRLRQVIWNLVTNALKFTPASGHVNVRLTRAGGHARLEVEDDGIGIEPAFLPRIFDRFAQQDSATTRAHGGLGLGLGLARHIVELHGGAIRAENNPGRKGVTVTVEIPLIAAAQSAAGESEPLVARAEGSLEGLHVLVVDDDNESRVVLPLVLEERGAKVEVAGSAEEARKVLAASTPDVIVCDVAMPTEDGLQFMRRLRALPPERGGKIPAAALTAYADEETRKSALEAGFQMHLAKPIAIDALLSAVASLSATHAAP